MAKQIDKMNQQTPRFASGGVIKGDSVPCLLEPGICIITKQAARALGAHGFEGINFTVNGRDLVAIETGVDAADSD